MNLNKLKLASLLLLSFCFSEARTLEVGGSNFGIITAGVYLQNPTEQNWYSPNGIKSLVGNYHLMSDQTKKELIEMAKNGQKQLAIVIWTIPSNSPVNEYGHTIKIQPGGKLLPQHKKNLQNILAEAARMGFKKIYFRIAHQGNCDPIGWTGWDESQYQENFNFTVDVKRTVESVERTLGLVAVYDLGVELGGAPGLAREYTKRAWIDWNRLFPSALTVGFSIAFNPHRLDDMIRDLKSVSAKLPQFFALDIYGNEFEALRISSEELNKNSLKGSPVVIMESFYNDSIAAKGFQEAQDRLGLRIVSVFQWPKSRSSTQGHFNMNFTPQYSEYLKLSER